MVYIEISGFSADITAGNLEALRETMMKVLSDNVSSDSVLDITFSSLMLRTPGMVVVKLYHNSQINNDHWESVISFLLAHTLGRDGKLFIFAIPMRVL